MSLQAPRFAVSPWMLHIKLRFPAVGLGFEALAPLKASKGFEDSPEKRTNTWAVLKSLIENT